MVLPRIACGSINGETPNPFHDSLPRLYHFPFLGMVKFDILLNFRWVSSTKRIHIPPEKQGNHRLKVLAGRGLAANSLKVNFLPAILAGSLNNKTFINSTPQQCWRFLGDSSHLFELKVLPATHGLRQTSRQNCFHRGFPNRHDVQLA